MQAARKKRTATTASPDGPSTVSIRIVWESPPPTLSMCFQNLLKTTRLTSTGMMKMNPVTSSFRSREIACMKASDTASWKYRHAPDPTSAAGVAVEFGLPVRTSSVPAPLGWPRGGRRWFSRRTAWGYRASPTWLRQAANLNEPSCAVGESRTPTIVRSPEPESESLLNHRRELAPWRAQLPHGGTERHPTPPPSG